ncbi:hypothetical protein B9Z55_000967 [Caenorhabditis nigoni]|uniref:Uncharacterized protein n=1 Tax=Caenorhabditis nigoni TaxID=1611254 RepID=A0A2G5VVS0_9PELO|nr:hypothetical protein B9Z55_000967 [Caenorhabditis nigoni]
MEDQSDKNACRDALRALEHVLIRDAADSSFSAINNSKYGFYSPRNELRPGRLYYIAEPMLIRAAEKEGKMHADNSHLDLLPYIEFFFVKSDKKCKLPVFNQTGEWTTFNDANICICIRFKHAFLFSQHTIRKLAKTVPKSPVVRSYTNFYRYATGRPSVNKNLELLTQFPNETDIQQHYKVDSSKLASDSDSLVVEMFLGDLRELPKLIETLRSEWMHASLWESIVAMCEPNQEENSVKKEVRAASLELLLRRNEFNLKFDTECGNMSMQISEKEPRRYFIRTVSQLTGDTPSSDLDNLLTEKLNSTWSIPITLTFALSTLNCRLNSLLSPLNYVKPPFDSDKRQQWWFGANTTHTNITVEKVKKRIVLEIGPVIEPKQLVYTRQEDEELCGSLLSSFGEVDQYYVQTSTIGKTGPQPRPKREPSQLASMGMMSAELDMARNRQSMEHAMHPRPQDLRELSSLESARIQMRQSIGAAHAVGLASHQGFTSPGPMRHHPYMGGSFDSPGFPYGPNIPASIPFPDAAAFGKGKQRKPRAKKQPGEEGAAPSGRGKGRKGRGAAAVGAGSGRKSSGVVGENQYGMDQMRPQLQRSFSDFQNPMNPQHMNPQYAQHMQHMQQMQNMQQYQQMQQMQQYQQNQQYQQSQQYRMHMQQQQLQQHQMQSPQQQSGMNTPKSQRLTDEDSDEDVDPPRLPKPQVSAASRPSLPPPHQLGNPMVGYPGMPLQSPNHLPLTPSPLSAPPKPFSPEQQHFGTKMRDNAYWKEAERNIDVKPDIEKLKQQMAASSSSGPVLDTATTSSSSDPSTSREPSNATESASSAAPLMKPPTTAQTPKKKLGLEATLSKLRGVQEQALQKQEQQRIQQQDSVDSTNSEQPTPQPQFIQQPGPPLAPNQVNRVMNMSNVFDDEAGSSTNTSDVKPSLASLQKSTDPSTPGTSSSIAQPSGVMPSLKKEVEEQPPPEREKEKLIVKIPKILKVDDRREERREKERDRDRDRDRDGDRERDRYEKEDKSQREKEKKERDKERKRRDRDRSEAKKEKDSSSGTREKESKKRKREKSEEKDKREPERKKEKKEGKELSKTTTKSVLPMIPTRTLKNFRIPKKDTVEDDKKEPKDESIPGPSTSSESSTRKEVAPAPISRKESTTSSVAPLQRKESFTSQSGAFPPSDHHREPPKKKPPPISGPAQGSYSGSSNAGPISSSSRGSGNGGSRKPPILPPPALPMRGPPSDQMYRERTGSMRGFPPSSHYHGSGGSGGSKQVASYAQGLPPGMGPPAAKPHGNSYQASHGMPTLGPPQISQREQPPPPPQMIPLPKENPPPPLAPPSRTHRDSRARGGGDNGPDSPEEGTLRIDDE